jgi:hypothetical protein
VIFEAVVVAHNPGLAVRRMQALHTGSEYNPGEVAAPTVVHTGVVVAAHTEVAVHSEMEVAVVRTVAVGAVQAAHTEVEAVHTEVAVPNLAVGLDHKTWIISPVGYSFLLFAPFKETGNTILQVWKQTVKL